MSLYKELSYETDNDIETVKAIQFCVLSPQEIEKRSVVEVLTNESYNGTEPVKNGLFDSRMGVIENNKICGTCEQKNNFCPGHFGHIKLAKPVYHIQFFEYVHKVLKCVCFRCSKLVLDNPADIQAIVSKKHSRMKRFEMAYKLCQKTKRKFCDMEGGCRARRPDRIKKDGFVKIVMEWNVEDEDEPKKVNFDAEEVLRLLERISDEDAEILGFHRKFNRPEWMICTVLPVPPPAVRPSVRTETGQRMEDDITHKLNDIVKYNLAIKSRIEKNCTKEQIAVQVMMLQYHVATLVDNQIPGMSPSVQRTGRPLRSLFERLKSKEGRIRGNLMGKRVDFSARTVITPDPNISIDEIGVPVRIAMNLTFPDVVNEYNIEMLTGLVHNGPGKYPGAKYVKKRDPYRTIRLKNMDTTQIELEIGDVVDRHLINGDYVLFNRQPSLHKMSMQGHRVRVMPFDTFRLNVCVTKNYNADFDGDEMNVHAPQSLQTRNELIQLASVPTQIITPKDSKPIISIVQDVALGVYRITKSFIKITEKQMMNLMCPNPRFSGVLPSPAIHDKKIKYWSGRQALSSTIPVNVNFKGSNNSFDDKNGEDKENYVIIENGQIKQGRLDTKIYQDRTRGLVHSIFNEYGPEETRHFFDNTQQLICNWLVLNGFSVGISDLVVENDTNASLKKIIHDMKVKVYDVLRDIHMKKFQNESILNDNDKFEEDVNKLLNDAIQQAGKVGLEKIDDINNRMINMIKAGAKGNTVNISQMIACLGQQNIDGKRVAYGFDSRTLPHYTKYDDGPESRGFVESSFIKGLTPQEFFFHSMGGREGLIDTAVKTSSTGYIQRKLVKAMEDCKVSYDMTIRNANGNIIQFLYGEDGIDAIKIESHPLFYISMTMEKMDAEYMISAQDDLASVLAPDVIQDLHKSDPKWMDKMYAHFKQLHADRDYFINKMFQGVQETSVMYPVSFVRIINNTIVLRQRFGMRNIMSDLSPIFVLEEIQKLCDSVRVSPNNKGTKLFEMLARMYLSPKQVIFRHGLDKTSFKQIIQQVKMRFYDSIVHPSEMVGVVAAQSIGEPLSQCTLNTFHLSGVGSASKATRGVPRIEELTRVTKNVKAPSVTVFLKPEHAQNKAICLQVKNKLETTTFKHIIKTSKIFFDPSDTETTISNDANVVKMYKDFQIENKCDRASAPWLLRLELDRQKMLEVGLTTIELNHALKNQFNNRISCIFSDDNAEDVIFRIKLYEDVSEETTDMLTDLKALESTILENIILKGVEKLQSASLEKEKKVLYNPETRAFEKTFEYKLYTEGTNLLQVLCMPYIDGTRTVSNDVNEIYKIFGIEAARQCLYNEILAVITDAKVNVNYRHLALLVDTMTSKGAMMSIDRHGINKGDIGPLAKCSFEEVNDVLVKAGVFSEIDRVNGVSANIMLGQIAPCGTGDTEILIDESKLLPPFTSTKPKKITMNDDTQEFESSYTKDTVCHSHNFELKFDLPEIVQNIKRKKIVEVN